MEAAEVNQTSEQVKATLTKMVAQRAYEKYAGRGYQHGHDQQDWLEAEKEIFAKPENKLPIPEGILALNRKGRAQICAEPPSAK